MLKYLMLFSTLLFLFNAEAKSAPKQPTICLNMIVKDESQVIVKCLESVKDTIDYWIIVDTGSHDGTQQIIKKFMKGIPGELHERPWKNFEHNRNEALSLAKNKGDYILFLDADEVLTLSAPLKKSELDKDSYLFTIRQIAKGIDHQRNFQRMLLINNHLNWKWEGVLHETIVCSQPTTVEHLKEAVVVSYEGARSQDPQKFLKDAQVLEKALEEDPNNSRYVYYLAQSYLNVPDYPKALKYYQKRATMGGWDQEVFFSLYSIGILQAALEMPPEVWIKSYCDAYLFRPSRAEPLYRIAEHYTKSKCYFLGHLIAQYALSIPMSTDAMFVDQWIYEWGLHLQLAECSFCLGKYEESRGHIQKLLTIQTLPEDIHHSLKQNLAMIEQLEAVSRGVAPSLR